MRERDEEDGNVRRRGKLLEGEGRIEGKERRKREMERCKTVKGTVKGLQWEEVRHIYSEVEILVLLSQCFHKQVNEKDRRIRKKTVANHSMTNKILQKYHLHAWGCTIVFL